MSATRRNFFSIFAAPAIAALPTVASALPEPTGPIDPAEYIAAKEALGWRLVAAVCQGKPCGGYIEYNDKPYRPEDHVPVYRLNSRAQKSGLGFSKRVAGILFARGLIEDVTPRRSRLANSAD